MQDKIGPFIKELGRIRHFFHWQIEPKTGLIRGVHREYEDWFSVVEAVAWGGTGLRYPDEYHAARAVGAETIVEVILGACRNKSDKVIRPSLLNVLELKER